MDLPFLKIHLFKFYHLPHKDFLSSPSNPIQHMGAPPTARTPQFPRDPCPTFLPLTAVFKYANSTHPPRILCTWKASGPLLPHLCRDVCVCD